jgi:hypothetical protein
MLLLSTASLVIGLRSQWNTSADWHDPTMNSQQQSGTWRIMLCTNLPSVLSDRA